MKKLFLVLLSCCTLLTASAQYSTDQNKIWTFGDHAGVDFTSGTPVPIVSSINVSEGCASISNVTGLLFYTDGYTVYNRLGTVMPGGAAITSFMHTGSTTQGAVIIPFPDDINKHYIFSLESQESGGGRLAYSIVDMTLDGGLGDIVTGSAGIIIDSGMSEKMISVRGNDCNVWLITHKKDSAHFYTYNITPSGLVALPVISNVGTFGNINGYLLGTMKCSHDRQKLVTTSYIAGNPNWGVELYDLDPGTGIVSNCRVIDVNPMFDVPYGAEFSADNTKLYTTGDGVIQWDISLPTLAAILASKTVVCSLSTISDLRLGPDGRIYFNSSSTNFLDRINFPNIAGPGCNCTPNAVPLAPSTKRYGLPNKVWSVQSAISGVTSICVGSTTSLTVAGGPGVTWSTRNPGVATISATGVVTGIAPGTAIISYSAAQLCNGFTTVTINPNPDSITGPATICTGQSVTLSNTSIGGTWSVSSGIASINTTTGMLTGLTPGTVNVTYTTPAGCSVVRSDTVKPCITIVETVNTTNQVELYPNPANIDITVKAEAATFTSFSIYNAIGQKVTTHEITGSQIQVNVNAYPPGEYLVVFTGKGRKEIARFTKW